jgi:NAD(P)-dependent dehydrogenase (short-subunit alcohol dehydrogenase family)
MPDKPGIALVTGGNRGIGFEVCRQLAERGFTVLLSARDTDKARAAAAKIKTKATGHIEPLALDVSDPRSIERAAAEVSKRHDHLDVLINNAGINYDTWETAESPISRAQ